MKILKEADGKSSMTRYSIFIILWSYILWGTYVVYKTDVIPDLPYSVAMLLVGLYGFNKSNINFNVGGAKG